MTPLDEFPQTKFGIDEVYIHEGFPDDLLEKLQQRAVISLDSEDTVVLNNVSHDMILIFRKRVASQNIIYRFLEYLHQYSDKENFIRSNTLLNEEELFSAIKLKNFVLVTHRILPKEACSPPLKMRR
jgi:hypothetical protein